MTSICRYCNALKFKRETAGLCCASGKVKLDPLLTPPQALKPLFDGSDPDSSHFLQHILEYNNCFRMTSFGANIIREGGFMPTCKVKDTTHITNHSHQHNELQHITTTYTYNYTITRSEVTPYSSINDCLQLQIQGQIYHLHWFNGANTR
ncbi:hypothetical protein WA026_022238 [Henosepilachna vigintioctopunctata]|uniref:Uncharacterized protein n=1 Tax=Henosepilachna vigintioctopunctata TaxID=420089 RepID=A0AAW1UP73_9CUCU